MRTRAVVGALALAAAGVTVTAPCLAAHHLWQIQELYSNADGSVQYIQLFNPTTDAGETFVSTFTLKENGTTIFTFNTDLPAGSTSNQWILIATPSATFSNGVTPDYNTLPPNSLTTGGGTLNYAGLDSLTYPAMPIDGVHSLVRVPGTPPTTMTAVNSATKFNGPTGAIVLPSSAPVPAMERWALAVLVGGLLLAGSGLLRKRAAGGPATQA
jgi:hypothetical protein